MVEDVLCLFEPLGVIRVYRRQYKRSSRIYNKIWSRLNKEKTIQEFEETRPGPAYTHTSS